MFVKGHFVNFLIFWCVCVCVFVLVSGFCPVVKTVCTFFLSVCVHACVCVSCSRVCAFITSLSVSGHEWILCLCSWEI